MSLITLLVTLLLIALLLWATRALLAAWGVVEPFRTTIYVIVVVIAVLLVLRTLGLGPGLGVHL